MELMLALLPGTFSASSTRPARWNAAGEALGTKGAAMLALIAYVLIASLGLLAVLALGLLVSA